MIALHLNLDITSEIVWMLKFDMTKSDFFCWFPIMNNLKIYEIDVHIGSMTRIKIKLFKYLCVFN